MKVVCLSLAILLVGCAANASAIPQESQRAENTEAKISDHETLLAEAVSALIKEVKEGLEPEAIEDFIGVERVSKEEVRLITCAVLEAIEKTLTAAIRANQLEIDGKIVAFVDPDEKLTVDAVKNRIGGLMEAIYIHWDVNIKAKDGGSGFDPASIIVDADDIREAVKEKLLKKTFTRKFADSSLYARIVGKNQLEYMVEPKAETLRETTGYQILNILQQIQQFKRDDKPAEDSAEIRKQFIEKLKSLTNKI